VTSGNDFRRGRGIATSFGVSALASIAVTVVYALGGQVQLEGVLLGLALGGLSLGLILWAKEMMPGGHYVQERERSLAQPSEQAEVADSFHEGDTGIERRSFLTKMLVVALGALGLAALFPIRSLGSRPGRSLFVTEWDEGSRLVTLDGTPVRPEDLAVGGVLTVFPEGFTQPADSQTLLIRLAPDEYEALPGRENWGPLDLVAYSKICTHAGCPVGLYQPTNHELLCPCHQSVFDVLDGARPLSGPAERALPQLPLAVDEEGYLVAQSDYQEPVGPAFWGRND
jgi:ubiquinol-cytochrome c reductase iron-sulfur subunit